MLTTGSEIIAKSAGMVDRLSPIDRSLKSEWPLRKAAEKTAAPAACASGGAIGDNGSAQEDAAGRCFYLTEAERGTTLSLSRYTTSRSARGLVARSVKTTILPRCSELLFLSLIAADLGVKTRDSKCMSLDSSGNLVLDTSKSSLEIPSTLKD